MPNILKSNSHVASDAAAKVVDPAGFEQRREEFVQRMITEGLAKLEDKLTTRKGKRVFRDEVKFQKVGGWGAQHTRVLLFVFVFLLRGRPFPLPTSLPHACHLSGLTVATLRHRRAVLARRACTKRPWRCGQWWRPSTGAS